MEQMQRWVANKHVKTELNLFQTHYCNLCQRRNMIIVNRLFFVQTPSNSMLDNKISQTRKIINLPDFFFTKYDKA